MVIDQNEKRELSELSLEIKKSVVDNFPRLGRLKTGSDMVCELPATAPVIRRKYEADAVVSLVRRGAEISTILIPISRTYQVASELAPVIGVAGVKPLVASVQKTERPLVIADPESEAFSFLCNARVSISRRLSPSGNKKLPKWMQVLFSSGLSSGYSQSTSEERLESGAAWRKVRKEYGLASLRRWFEIEEARTTSSVFIAPAPITRASMESVKLSFDIGLELMNTVQDPAFVGRGIQLLIHSEVFADNDNASEAREGILAEFNKLSAEPSPYNNLFVLSKIVDGGDSLIKGPNTKTTRSNLGEFIFNLAEVVRKVSPSGILFVQNLGTWAIAGLDCGADVVDFSCDGRPLAISRIVGNNAGTGHEVRTEPPWLPQALCNGVLKEFKRMWKEKGAFPVSSHMQPKPWFEWAIQNQRKYRAEWVISSLLDVGKEFRDALQGQIPLGDCVRSRVSRMKEQDPLFDICRSLS